MRPHRDIATHVGFVSYGTPLGPVEVLTDEQYATFATEGEAPSGAVPNPNRFVAALFGLLNQVIVDVSEAEVDRATARRITRKNLPVRVQTVKLRRKTRVGGDDEPVGDGHVDWKHQWLVRGHWGWRKCRHDHPMAEEYEKGHRARVYVTPHWKGPDDKPMLISEKVWGLAQ